MRKIKAKTAKMMMPEEATMPSHMTLYGKHAAAVQNMMPGKSMTIQMKAMKMGHEISEGGIHRASFNIKKVTAGTMPKKSFPIYK